MVATPEEADWLTDFVGWAAWTSARPAPSQAAAIQAVTRC
jgi:hypothetical protein